MAQRIERVGVLGAGLMGHGITQVAAQSGYEVVVREVDQATLEKGIGRIEKQLARAVEKQKLGQEDADAVRARIQGTLDYGDLRDCDPQMCGWVGGPQIANHRTATIAKDLDEELDTPLSD